jgi:organic radical activating enzyme
MEKIKRFIECLLPVTSCNLKCSYCYVIQRRGNEGKLPNMKYSVKEIEKALTVERLGGVCYFSICGAGETLIPEVAVDIAKVLLKNGHFVNITTNGTIDQRFDQLISSLTAEECERMHFAFSLHYIELIRINKLDRFVSNVNKVKKAGCSYLVQLNLCDEYIPHIDEIKSFCMANFGAYPQIAATRKEDKGKINVEFYTDRSNEEYIEMGKQFESPLFDFTIKNFNVKRKEFCYAGDWSFTLNLATGIMHRCYASSRGYDIFKNPEKPIPFCAIGKHCKSSFCMNSSHFMSLGVITEIETPTYAQLRNKATSDGGNWYSDRMNSFLSGKLSETNDTKINLAKIELKYISDCTYGMLARIYGKLKRRKKDK